MVIVSNNGLGIAASIQDQIFTPFCTIKDVGEGKGLGWAIAQQIITEKHGGTITCTSELGKGTTFTITLPLADA
ncbi:MAG: HAMP domain-containing histidine kinase [Spirulina sp. SIO3F2]|nr:HAMP domain-containing histidine kinase [Spirulina sp. SIO3F2]